MRRDLATADLREELPGIEPDRQLNDWGRSQRVEALFDGALGGFLYHYWFRVEVEGIENVPDRTGAVLAANHAGALPSDGLMVVKAVRESHPSRRSVHVTTDRVFRSVPGVGMVATKLGAVADHPANLQRLLFDESQLALVFPEGRSGPRKPINERYRLRRFDPGFVRAAGQAGAPIVPVAVVGSEESVPVLARLRPGARLPGPGPLRRLGRTLGLPVVPAVPLPAKYRIRFLEPVPPQDLASADAAEDLAQQIRALVQENLLEMVAARRSVWLG
ncbi:MAG TPA: lysophospholipid acyltransferase family protein [Solirubrobacteraceae bacterium]